MAISLLKGVSLVPGTGSGGGTITENIISEVSSGPFTITNEDIVFADGTFTINYPDPTTALKMVTVRNISGTQTLATPSGTIDVSTLTLGQATTQAPRASGWFEI